MQEKSSELKDEFSKTVVPDKDLIAHIASMGFDNEIIKSMLKDTANDMQKTIDNLLKMQSDGTYENTLKEIINTLPLDPSMPSTSNALNQIREKIAEESKEAEVNFEHILYFIIM